MYLDYDIYLSEKVANEVYSPSTNKSKRFTGQISP